MVKTIFLMLITVLLFTGCSDMQQNKQPPAPTIKKEKAVSEMTIEEKVSHGINTGTPADMYIIDPFSVFQPYSPWNPFQN